MAEQPTVLTPEMDDVENDGKSLIVAEDKLPEQLLLIPLHDRPLFPKMMGPIIIEEPALQQALMDIEDKTAPLYLGLLLTHPAEDSLARMPQNADDFFKVGVVVRVLQVSVPKPGAPMQLLVQALEATVADRL